MTILQGDCRTVLPTLADGSVQCCVTSPPYYGLRDYGTGTWSGGDPACGHVAGAMRAGLGLATSAASTRGGGHKAALTSDIQFRELCAHCGARRADLQIGLEQTPDAYVAELVAVFREVRRVLRDDGTLWLNLGDSYANDAKWGGSSGGKHRSSLHGCTSIGRVRRCTGLKPKDLIGIPWMVAFALRADGWYLRSAIIWHKPNTMPQSVTDRPTSAYENVFLFSKSARYLYDAKAIAEPAVGASAHDLTGGRHSFPGQTAQSGSRKALRSPTESRHRSSIVGGQSLQAKPTATRNARNVWTIATRPFKGAHFATMPPTLAERCILAGSKPGNVILDPFGGAGTTALCAERLRREAISIELNPTFINLANERLMPLFCKPIATRKDIECDGISLTA